MNETNEQQTAESAIPIRPRLAFYKPSPKGCGGALELELHPAHDTTEGSLMARFANQMTIGDRSLPTPTFPRFDWENAICIKFGFLDLAMMLQVFRGECESLGEGKGIYHRSPSGMARISLQHLVEPVSGYSFEISKQSSGGRGEMRAHIMLTSAEATGLTAAIADVLGVICFGIPLVIKRDRTAYRQSVKEMNDVRPF